MRLKIADIVRVVGGRLLAGNENALVTVFSTDSRTVKQGSLFVPIRGEKTDAHIYIDSVLQNGATASFTDHELTLEQELSSQQVLVLVKDCREALQKAAAFYRDGFSIPLVGITGSVGKTTAKEMVAQALSAKYHVMKTAGNQNSQVGVPLTVCTLRKEHQAAVVEMGVSMPGEMARLAAVAKPTCAVMTNIGVSHIEYLKSRENIMAEKAHVADYLPEDGVLFVNGDDDLLPTLKASLPHKVLTFGVGAHCDWRACDLNEADKGTYFTAVFQGESVGLFVPSPGLHNVRNALASLAVARHLGVPGEDAARAIGAYKVPAMRQQVLQCAGLTLIDDSYNASPDSMRGALEILASSKVPGKKVAVLADMLELGEYAQEGHREVGRYAAELSVDFLIGIGPLSKDIVVGYGEKNSAWFGTNGEAIAFLKMELKPGDALLVKGSRGMKTDEVVAAFKEEL